MKPDFFRTEKTFVTQSMMTNRTGDALPYDIEALLVQVQIQKCWTVDKEQKYVKWMDFEFYIDFNKDVAVTLYDIKPRANSVLRRLITLVQTPSLLKPLSWTFTTALDLTLTSWLKGTLPLFTFARPFLDFSRPDTTAL